MAAPEPSSPRKILSIDGGGARGVLAIEILTALEDALRREAGKPDLVLADVFDLVAGTSVGAIIAASIALGRPMTEGRRFFLDNLARFFRAARPFELLRHRYDVRMLEALLKDYMGEDTTLGSPRLRTLLMLVMQNATTDSPWIVSNNPHARYNDRALDDCNLDIPLWALARASAAAPTYFAPQTITLGRARPYRMVFLDGALTGLNNPAFKAFTMATTAPFGLLWPTGETRLLIASIGVGQTVSADAALEGHQVTWLWAAERAPSSIIQGADQEQDLLCRVFGRCRTGAPLDSELGDLRAGAGPVEPRLFTYHRLNPILSAKGLADLDLADLWQPALARIDAYRLADQYRRIGQAYAERFVSAALLEGFPLPRGNGRAAAQAPVAAAP